jgi:hypothetical protein
VLAIACVLSVCEAGRNAICSLHEKMVCFRLDSSFFY